MAFAVTHVLLTIILVDLYRDYVTKHKRYFTLHTILIAGVAGLLPDIDIPLGWIFNIFNITIAHGGITHTPFFGLLFLVPAFYLWYKEKHTVAVYFFVTAFGILFHLLLDLLMNERAYMLLYPFTTELFSITNFSYFSIPHFASAVDAIILLAWLYHEERKHKIVDFV